MSIAPSDIDDRISPEDWARLSPFRQKIIQALFDFKQAAHGGNATRAFWSGTRDRGPNCAAAGSMILGIAIADFSGHPIDYQKLLKGSQSEFDSQASIVRTNAELMLSDRPSVTPSPLDYRVASADFNRLAGERGALNPPGHNPTPGDYWMNPPGGQHTMIIVNSRLRPDGDWDIALKDNGTLDGVETIKRQIVSNKDGHWHIVRSDDPSPGQKFDTPGENRDLIDMDTFVAGRLSGKGTYQAPPIIASTDVPLPLPPVVHRTTIVPPIVPPAVNAHSGDYVIPAKYGAHPRLQIQHDSSPQADTEVVVPAKFAAKPQLRHPQGGNDRSH